MYSFRKLIKDVGKLLSEDEVVEKGAKKNPRQRAHEDEIQHSILVLAAEVIRCDRNYNDDTELFIRKFLTEHFGAAGVKLKMKSIHAHIEMGAQPLLKVACNELKMLTTDDSRLNIVGFLFGVAQADDYINEKELRVIKRIAGYLGVSDKDFKTIRERFVKDNNPYSLLGIEESATLAEVTRAYRRMVLKHHPDKRSATVSEVEANVKFREIKRAYQLIKANRDHSRSE